MTEIVAAAGLLLAWFAFRYERHRRWRESVEAAFGRCWYPSRVGRDAARDPCAAVVPLAKATG
jgi:hypothetical protein